MLSRKISFQVDNSDGKQACVLNRPQQRTRIIEGMGRPPMALVSGVSTFLLLRGLAVWDDRQRELSVLSFGTCPHFPLFGFGLRVSQRQGYRPFVSVEIDIIEEFLCLF